MDHHDHLPPAAPLTLSRNGYAAAAAESAGGATRADSPENGGPLEFWRIVRRRKGSVILIGFAGALSGFLLTVPQTPIYQARTSLEIVGVNDNFLNTKQVKPVAETGATSETADLQTQIKILQSESLLGRVLDKLKREPAPQSDGRLSAWRRALSIPQPTAAEQREQALYNALRAVRVRATGVARMLEITVDSSDPRAAADFANTLANEFIEQNLEARWKITERTSQWLTRQIEDVRIKLERSEDGLQSYARQSGLMFTMEKTSVSEEKLIQLQKAVSAAQAERMARQSRHEMALASPPETLPDVLSDEALRDHQAKLAELRREMADLISTYTPEHPKVQRIQAQAASVESTLHRERADILKRIENEYREAARKETLVASAYADQAQQVSGESEKAIRYNILKREVDSNRQLYDTMLGQLKQSAIAAAMRASNVRIVDPARLPTRPYKPDALISSALGLAMGIFLAFAFVVLRERGDRSVQQPGEAPVYLNLPELGVIPSVKSGLPWRDRNRGKRLTSSRKAGETACLTTADHEPAANVGAGIRPAGFFRSELETCVELVTWQRRSSLISESFRSVLMSILFSSENGSLPKVLMVTSAGPSEGKSTVLSNLGIAIAELGQKTLLIDADLRKPRLHHIFGLSNERGLSDILRNRKATPGLEGLIHGAEVPGLFVLTSGPGAAVSTSLFYGPALFELLKRLRGEFGTILIDTPPMAQLPDARAISRVADSVILVLRSGKTSRDAAIAARRRFSEDGATLLGTVLNGWKPGASTDQRHEHYRESYQSFQKHYGSRSAHA